MRTGTSYSQGLMDVLIATLTSSRNTRLFKQILRERELSRYKEASIRTGLSRLKKAGYVRKESSGWKVTREGTRYYKDKQLLSYISSPFDKNTTPDTIISFDIPERNRFLRNWLRNQIKIFNYTMLQQSLWIGPGPLPPSFLKRLEELGIRKNIKTFRITKRNT